GLLGLWWCRRKRRGSGRCLLLAGWFCLVVGDDTPDRRQNLLHRGFLDLCRLRHLRLQIINALACVVLHQARRNGPAPDSRACTISVASPTCPQIKPARFNATLRRTQGIEASWPCRMRATNRLAAFLKAMSWRLTIASNGPRNGFNSHCDLLRESFQQALALDAPRGEGHRPPRAPNVS